MLIFACSMKADKQLKIAEMNNVIVAEDAARVGRDTLCIEEGSVTTAKVTDREDTVCKLNSGVMPRYAVYKGIESI